MTNGKSNDSEKSKAPSLLLIILLEELILLLNAALKTFRLYSRKHPSFLESLSKLKPKFDDLFEAEDVIEMVVKKDKLLFRDEIVGQDNTTIKVFTDLLYYLGIQSVFFRKGLSEEDISNFLEIIVKNPDEVMSIGGVNVLFNEKKSSFIEIKEREKLDIIKEEDLVSKEEIPEAAELSEEDALKEYFQRQEAQSTKVLDKVFYILTESPSKFAKFLIELNKSSPDKLVTLLNVIEKTAQNINQKYSDERRHYYKKLTDAINFLPDEIKIPLVTEKLLSRIDTDSSNTGASIIRQFSTSDLVGIFYGKITKENIPLTQIKNVLNEVPSLGEDKKAEIISGLKARQTEPQQAIDSMSIITERGTEELDALSLADLESKIPELSTYTKEEIEKIETLTKICSKDDVMSSTTNILLEVLPTISEINIYLRFIDMLQDFLEIYLSKDKFISALRILKIFKEELNKREQQNLEYIEKLETAIKEAAGESKIYNLILTLEDLDKDSKEFEIINSYLELLSEDAINILLVILGKEERRIIRKLIVQVLIDIGQKHIEVFAHRLSDERWYLVRNIVSIFGEIRDEKAIDYMKPILHHRDPRVRSETIRSLGLIGGEKSAKLLIIALKDKNKELRQKVIRWLGEMGESVAIPYFAKILRKVDILSRMYNIKEEAIKSLEKINSPEVIPILEELSQKKWFQFSAKSKNLRSLAGEILKKIKG